MTCARILTIAAAAIATIAIAAPAAAQQKMNFKYSANSRNGVCYFGVDGGKVPGVTGTTQLEFSYRVRDGNLGFQIKANAWPLAREKSAVDENFPATLTFDTKKTTTSRSGGFNSGFSESAWAGWGAENSPPVFDMLKDAKSVRVRMNNTDFGSWDLQMKGLAHVVLSDCAKAVREGREY